MFTLRADKPNRNRTLSIATLAVACVVPLAACSSNNSSSGSGSSAISSTARANSSAVPVAGTGTEFGSACANVPKGGPGSFAGMATAPVATAASKNPVLSTLVSTIKVANFVDPLNSAKDITVFAPDNSAFAAIPTATLNKLLADPTGDLAKILNYHVVQGELTPASLAGTHKTLNGATMNITGSGDSFMINGKSMVVCGNVKTANATVYIIDQVLMPPS